MAKRGKYVTIQEWMLELDLRTPAELLVYALIWGFTQDGASKFQGSVAYIATWLTGYSDLGTRKILKALEERGLIRKTLRPGQPSIFTTPQLSYGLPRNSPRNSVTDTPQLSYGLPRNSVTEATTLHNNSKKTIERDNAGACPLEEALSLSPFLSDKFKNIWKALVTSPGFSGKTYNQLMATSLKLRKVPEEEAFKMCLNAIEVGASYVRKFKS